MQNNNYTRFCHKNKIILLTEKPQEIKELLPDNEVRQKRTTIGDMRRDTYTAIILKFLSLQTLLLKIQQRHFFPLSFVTYMRLTRFKQLANGL